MFSEYHKIETPYERDMDGSKKLIEGQFRSKYVKYLKDCQWIFTEKVDGTNIIVYWDGHNVSIHGRTKNSQIPAPLMEYLTKTFLTPEVEELFEQKFGEKEVHLYGEGFGGKIQEVGKKYRPDNAFILFDVMVGTTWLSRENVADIAKAFGVEAVPVIGYCTLMDAINMVKDKYKSMIAQDKDLLMEGFVCRPAVELKDKCGHRVIVKVKVHDFCENI